MAEPDSAPDSGTLPSRQPRLYALFSELRQQGVPIGLGDYLSADRTLRDKSLLGGHALDDLESLKRICRLLWAKSYDDLARFDDAFDRLVAPLATPTVDQDGELRSELPPETGLQLPDSEEANGATESERLDTEAVAHSSISLEIMPDGSVPGVARQQRVYQLTPQLPIARREMTGIWRHLRQLRRQGPLTELDIDGTIDAISRTGFLLRPALRAHRRNQARLLILLDVQGSMAPLSLLTDAAIESILRGGLLGHTSISYFHDFPDQFLYSRPTLSEGVAVDTVLDEDAKNSSVLIISDAGAARRNYSAARVEGTREFLKKLGDYTYRCAWLNPVPADRWSRSTAEDISKLVLMFPLQREGLIDAVSVLRGQPYHREIELYE